MAEYKSFYKTVQGNEGNKCYYPTRLDTYGCGCRHDCGYCYAKSLLDFRGLWHPDDPAVADIAKIKKQIAKIPAGTVVRLGGMTDCFQPCENEHHVTYETIKALQDRGLGYLIVTKSPLVAGERFLALMDKDLAHIQISVTSTDEAYSRTIEQAPAPALRLKAIEKLQGAGYDVAMRLSPFMPDSGHMDLNVINAVKVDKVLVEFLRVNTFIKRSFPGYDTSAYTEKVHNYLQLPLETKLEMLKGLNPRFQITVCEDTDEGYAYFRDYYNPNPRDCCNLRKVGA